MIICLQWEGRSYGERRLKWDLEVCAKAFGMNTPIRVTGYDVGELITADEVPDFTKVLTIRGGNAIGFHYNVHKDGVKWAPFEDWTLPTHRADGYPDDKMWARLQDGTTWEPHASLPHFLWWLMEIDSIMQSP